MYCLEKKLLHNVLESSDLLFFSKAEDMVCFVTTSVAVILKERHSKLCVYYLCAQASHSSIAANNVC